MITFLALTVGDALLPEITVNGSSKPPHVENQWVKLCSHTKATMRASRQQNNETVLCFIKQISRRAKIKLTGKKPVF